MMHSYVPVLDCSIKKSQEGGDGCSVSVSPALPPACCPPLAEIDRPHAPRSIVLLICLICYRNTRERRTGRLGNGIAAGKAGSAGPWRHRAPAILHRGCALFQASEGAVPPTPPAVTLCRDRQTDRWRS
ncbi:hypothetical protein AOLI_G00296090 [Acnodon oligacanthus]